jgi:hypothetical protein
MRLRAIVKEATEHYQAYYGTLISDSLTPIATDRIPCPDYIDLVEIVDEIAESGKAYYIIYYDKNGNYLADSFCQTLEDAKEEARLEFNLSDEDWEVIEA